MTKLLGNFMAHVRNGTFPGRLQYEWDSLIASMHRKWWKNNHIKGGRFQAPIQRGIRMEFLFDCQLSRLIYCENFEWAERQFIRQFLKPGDTFVDVGANIGLFTLIAAKTVGPKGRVIAFEPTPQVYRRLNFNIQLNSLKKVIARQEALSDEDGVFPFNMSDDGFDAWNSFASPIGGQSFRKAVVNCRKWDRLADELDLLGKVQLMKIDVEGWETHVLNGAGVSLGRGDAPVLLVEFTDAAAQSAGSSCKELYLKLRELGYRLFSYDPIRHRMRSEPFRHVYPYCNLIATKSIKVIEKRIEVPWIN